MICNALKPEGIRVVLKKDSSSITSMHMAQEMKYKITNYEVYNF